MCSRRCPVKVAVGPLNQRGKLVQAVVAESRQFRKGLGLEATARGRAITIEPMTSGEDAYQYSLIPRGSGDEPPCCEAACSAGGATGYGTVFKVSASGTLTTVYNFCQQPNCTDGYFSNGAPMVTATDGNSTELQAAGPTISALSSRLLRTEPTQFCIASMARTAASHSDYCRPLAGSSMGPPVRAARTATAPFLGSPPQVR